MRPQTTTGVPRAPRAVIYARYSSDEQRPQSIEDQVVGCRQYCADHGWMVMRVYSDAALTGSTNLRPEYQQLLTDADAGRFDFVVVESLDRLSRRLADLAHFQDLAEYRQIKVHATDRGEMNAFMVAILGGMAQAYLKDLKSKTKRGLSGKIRAGLSAGSIGYGYRADPAEKGKRLKDEAEAAVVRRIFEDYANGASPRTLAATLNAEGVPGPGGRPWIDTTIRGQVVRGTGILNNELYVGKIVWNRCTYERPPGAVKRVARPNPKEQWETSHDETLRIVDDALWRRVKDKQGEVRTEMRRDENGVALNRAHRAQHLLSGLIFCGACGAPFAMRDARHYGCSNFRSKGTCKSGLKVRRADLERLVGDTIRHRWMNEEAMARLRAEVIAERERMSGDTDAAKAKLRAALKRTEAQIERVVADSGHNKSLVARLKTLEAEAARIKTEIAALDEAAAPEPAEIDDDIEAKIWAAAADIETLISDPTRPDALRMREMVRSMIERITVTRHESGAVQIGLKGELAGVMQAAGLVERHSLDRALGREKAPAPEASGAEDDALSVVAGVGFEPAAFRL